MDLDLEAILGTPPTRRDAETAKARATENNRRHAEARRLAGLALTRLHPEEFRELLDQALARVHAQRGPLPGDA